MHRFLQAEPDDYAARVVGAPDGVGGECGVDRSGVLAQAVEWRAARADEPEAVAEFESLR